MEGRARACTASGTKKMNQDVLIRQINIEETTDGGYLLPGESPKRVYEKLCGRLRLEDIFTTDTVYAAAMECSAGFKNKKDTQSFLKNVNVNTYRLCQEVLNGTFKPRYYHTHIINERGKLRVIKPPTFTCKIVQKVLCNYLIRPLLEVKMISTSYASIKGRGTAKMHEDICECLNRHIYKGDDFVVILYDFKGYFASIDTSLLYKELERYIEDKRIIGLIAMFTDENGGLSLGNELSQIPASWFPSKIDHYFKDRLGIDCFRYMDDTLQIVPREKTKECIDTFKSLATRLNLVCPDEKIHVYKKEEGFTFCKERYVFNRQKTLYDHLQNPKIAGKEEHKLVKFGQLKKEHRITDEEIIAQAREVIGSIKSHPHTHKEAARLASLANNITRERTALCLTQRAY